MSFQLTSLRYYQVAQAKKQTHFYWKFFTKKIQPKKWFKKSYFWCLNIMILQSMKFLITERMFFNKLTKRFYSWIQEKNSKK